MAAQARIFPLDQTNAGLCLKTAAPYGKVCKTPVGKVCKTPGPSHVLRRHTASAQLKHHASRHLCRSAQTTLLLDATVREGSQCFTSPSFYADGLSKEAARESIQLAAVSNCGPIHASAIVLAAAPAHHHFINHSGIAKSPTPSNQMDMIPSWNMVVGALRDHLANLQAGHRNVLHELKCWHGLNTHIRGGCCSLLTRSHHWSSPGGT